MYYYPRTMYNITESLLNTFKNLIVKTYDKTGNPVGNPVEVPIMANQPEKEYQWLLQNHYFDKNNQEHGQRFYIKLPRMALCFQGVTYAPDRATSVEATREWLTDTVGVDGNSVGEIMKDIQPAPYNLNFMLYIRTDSYESMFQLLENILPYFNPKLQLRVKEFSFLNIERTFPVNIDSISPRITEDIGENDYRQINLDLPLTVEAVVYRPWSPASIIQVINTRYFINNSEIDSIGLSGVLLSDDVPLSGSLTPGDFNLSGTNLNSNLSYEWFQGENLA